MRFIWVLLAVLGVWYFWDYRDAPELPVPAALAGKIFAGPVQGETKRPAIMLHKGRLQFLATYEVTARVLARSDYHFGKQSGLSPVDFALGWGPMSGPGIAKRLSITQGYRTYRYSWSDAPPMEPQQIILNSANTHLIPANEAVAKKLAKIRKNQIVTLKGYLVYYRHENDNGSWWDWRSSTTRGDTGDGSCEVLYVENVTVY